MLNGHGKWTWNLDALTKIMITKRPSLMLCPLHWPLSCEISVNLILKLQWQYIAFSSPRCPRIQIMHQQMQRWGFNEDSRWPPRDQSRLRDNHRDPGRGDRGLILVAAAVPQFGHRHRRLLYITVSFFKASTRCFHTLDFVMTLCFANHTASRWKFCGQASKL